MNQIKEKLQEFWKKVQKFFAKMYTETPNKEKNEESNQELGNSIYKTDQKGAIRFKGWSSWRIETVL